MNMYGPARGNPSGPASSGSKMVESNFRLLAVLAACIGMGVTGCYGYYQPSTPDLAGHEVQLGITDSGSIVLAPQVGNRIEAVEGKLISDSEMRYQVAVTAIRRRDGQESGWNGEFVNIPHAVVSSVMERRFSRSRTTLFALATTFAMVTAKRAFGGPGGANAPGAGPGGGTGPR
jgi:hypothetical protein